MEAHGVVVVVGLSLRSLGVELVENQAHGQLRSDGSAHPSVADTAVGRNQDESAWLCVPHSRPWQSGRTVAPLKVAAQWRLATSATVEQAASGLYQTSARLDRRWSVRSGETVTTSERAGIFRREETIVVTCSVNTVQQYRILKAGRRTNAGRLKQGPARTNLQFIRPFRGNWRTKRRGEPHAEPSALRRHVPPSPARILRIYSRRAAVPSAWPQPSPNGVGAYDHLMPRSLQRSNTGIVYRRYYALVLCVQCTVYREPGLLD